MMTELIAAQATEALRAVISEAETAQQDILMAMDQIESLSWPCHSADGDDIAGPEVALCKLCLRLTRIIARAERGLPPNFAQDNP